ncbi:DUF192 domain-containing protein [Rhodobacteraceae bacterium LMO-12]|nr:DUF192 domain-containing protein [Rhodobacteraceae bacterium LMO-JJ12]
MALAFLLFGAAPILAESCREDTVFLRGEWGTARFNVELADTVRLRARGLMHRDSLPTSAGMLFIYPRPSFVAFWMKNTRIPLDMIFLDAQGVVQRVHHQAVPGDLTQIPGGSNILAVLEINGGLARAIGITEGSEMHHPAFGAKAAWPCE